MPVHSLQTGFFHCYYQYMIMTDNQNHSKLHLRFHQNHNNLSHFHNQYCNLIPEKAVMCKIFFIIIFPLFFKYSGIFILHLPGYIFFLHLQPFTELSDVCNIFINHISCKRKIIIFKNK